MKQERLKEGQYYHIYNRGNNRRDLFLEPIHYEHFMTLYDKYVTPVAETLAWVLMPNHFHLVVRIKEDMVYKYSNPYQLNADRSGDAVRFSDEPTEADLSACTAPDNVGLKGKGISNQLNADRSIDAVRFAEQTTKGDLTASARPVNVEIPSNNVEQKLLDKSWFEDHKWETIEMKLFNGIGEPKKPVPHRHFAHLFNAYARYFNKRTDGTGNLFERPFKRKLIHNEKYLKQVILYVHNNPIHHGFCSHLLEYPWSSYITCISDKTTKLKREIVLKLFNERDGFKNQHNQKIDVEKIDVEKIEKWLELDEVDYTTELNNQFNADRPRDDVPDSKPIGTGRFANETSGADLSAYKVPDNVGQKDADEVRFDQFNADPDSTGTGRSEDAVRFKEKATAADLTASARPVNVGSKMDEVRYNQFNADSPDNYRGKDAVPDRKPIGTGRFSDETTGADLSAYKVPVEKKINSSLQPNYFNADRSKDAVRLTKEDTAVDLSVPIAIGRAPDNVERKNEVITKQTLKRN